MDIVPKDIWKHIIISMVPKNPCFIYSLAFTCKKMFQIVFDINIWQRYYPLWEFERDMDNKLKESRNISIGNVKHIIIYTNRKLGIR